MYDVGYLLDYDEMIYAIRDFSKILPCSALFNWICWHFIYFIIILSFLHRTLYTHPYGGGTEYGVCGMWQQKILECLNLAPLHLINSNQIVDSTDIGIMCDIGRFIDRNSMENIYMEKKKLFSIWSNLQSNLNFPLE